MIGKSTSEYWFIKTCIFGLYFIAPLSITYCIGAITLYGWKAARFPLPLFIECWAIAESLFYLAFYLPYRRHLQREAKHPPQLSQVERRILFDRCNANIPDHEEYMRKWMLGARSEDIKRENVKDFFLWAFFNRDGPPGEDDEELEEYIEKTEKHLGRKIEPGRGKAKCLRLTIDKADMLHRSLVWYLCVGFVDLLTYINLIRHGFTFHRTRLLRFFTLFPFRPQVLLARKMSPAKHITYWHRPHTSKTKQPILFIHGIGIGLYPYTNFLSELNSTNGLESHDPTDQVGIIAIELMPVSFRITHPALAKEETCAEIHAILRQHGWDKVVLVSHSYGSIVTTHLLKSPLTSPSIGSVVLIDPVSILLHLPDVAYNFTRRKPRHANEHQLWYFASMDMGVSHTLSRHFFWSENVLWKEDLGGRKTTVCLAGRDLIVNTEAVGAYMSDEKKMLTPSLATLSSSASSYEEMATNASKIRQRKELSADEKEYGDVSGDMNGVDWKSRQWVGKGLEVLWFEELDHAQVFDNRSTRRVIISAIKSYCVKS